MLQNIEPINDLTLEEILQLALTAADVDKKDPNAVRRLQELSGLTGKDVDGIWGKKSLNAWNESISQAYADEKQFQDAMARGQKSPYFEDMLDYSYERDKKINALQSQIEMVKERIARNKRTLFDNKGVTERVANMEFKKINSSDPSTLFRWREGQKDMKEANERVKQGSANKYDNEVEALLKKSIPTNYGEQSQLLDQVSSKIAEGKTLGLDVSSLKEMEDALTEKVNWSINNDNKVKKVKSLLVNLNLQLKNGVIDDTQYKEAINKIPRDFDDYELHLELDRESKLGEKKVTDNKNAQAVRERDKPILDKINEWRAAHSLTDPLTVLPANLEPWKKLIPDLLN